MNTQKLNQWIEKELVENKTIQKKVAPAPATNKTSAPKKTIPAKSNSSKTPSRRFSDHNPNRGRKTAYKRHAFHPTTRLKPGNHGTIRVIPMGGLEAIGQNMTFIEWENDIIVIDTGILFATHEEPGVNGIVPDIEYLKKNKHRIKGVIYTHGHLDHIGGVPYILPQLGFPPIFTTRLTQAMITGMAEEYGFADKLRFTSVDPKSKMRMGRFEVEFFHINHSIPECLGVVVNTPYGAIVTTVDFKFDYKPADGHMTDFAHIAHFGHKGVALHLCDSTNATIPGFAQSESNIIEPITKILKYTPGRIILTLFGSNMSRASRIIELAEKLGRTVYLSGRSLEKNVGYARKFNYLKCKDKTLKRLKPGVKMGPPDKTLIMCTGGQGEEFAALSRMARGEHKQVILKPEDTIVFSSSKIPGNELQIFNLMNKLVDKGVNLIEGKDESVHASGHGNQEDIKLMASLLDPKYFVPIHGDQYLRHANKTMISEGLDFPEDHVLMMEHGKGIVLNQHGAKIMSDKERVPTKKAYYEDMVRLREETIEERKNLGKKGIIIVDVENNKGTIKKINIRTHGFFLLGTDEKAFSPLKKELTDTFNRTYDPARSEKALEETLKKTAQNYLWQKYKKEPTIEVVL